MRFKWVTLYLKYDAIMDQSFIEFHYAKKLKPLELMLSSIDILNMNDGKKVYVKRCISVVSNDSNEIPQFGFVSVRKIDELPEDHSPKEFTIISTSNNENLSNELKTLIEQKMKGI